MINYYEILDIDEQATREEIDEKIKSEINRWRRRMNAPSPERQREANERMEQLREAQEILLDQAKRQAYDEELQNSRQGNSSEGGPRPTGHEGNNDQARELRDRYVFHMNEENYGEAIEVARQLTRIQPNNPYAWHDLAYANYRWNNYADARYEITHTLSLKQNEPLFFETAFDIYFYSTDIPDQESLQKSKEYIQKAISLDPNNPGYQANLASVYLQEGYYIDVINLLRPLKNQGTITAYGEEVLSRAFLMKVENKYSVPVTYQNGNMNFYFTDPEKINAALDLLQEAQSLAKLDDTKARVSRLQNTASGALNHRYDFKYLLVLIVAALWFLSALGDLKLFQMVISGGLSYLGWVKFRKPNYKINEEYINSLS